MHQDLYPNTPPIASLSTEFTGGHLLINAHVDLEFLKKRDSPKAQSWMMTSQILRLINWMVNPNLSSSELQPLDSKTYAKYKDIGAFTLNTKP